MTGHAHFNGAFIKGELLPVVHLVRNPAFSKAKAGMLIPLRFGQSVSHFHFRQKKPRLILSLWEF